MLELVWIKLSRSFFVAVVSIFRKNTGSQILSQVVFNESARKILSEIFLSLEMVAQEQKLVLKLYLEISCICWKMHETRGWFKVKMTNE